MKKRIIISVTALFCLFLVSCGVQTKTVSTNNMEDVPAKTASENNIENEIVILDRDDLFSYTVSADEGAPDTEGGYANHVFYAVLKDGTYYCYKVLQNTTGDNGYTTKYVGFYTTDDISLIKNMCEQQDESGLFSYTISMISESEDVTIVSQGMHDAESRNEDGTYKWYDEFNSYLE